MTETWVQMIVSVILGVAASSGFWTFMMRKSERNDDRTKMLIGLGHDRIVFLCQKYINRKSITHDEYENLYEYLYKPYAALGGNGTAKRLMDEVNKLPIANKDSAIDSTIE